jgi:ABC-type sulfate transport system permease subunit
MSEPTDQEAVAARGRRRSFLVAFLFLLPALILLGALVVYPIFYSVVRSLYSETGGTFVGTDNYRTMFASEATRTAIKNTFIWVVFAPSIVTALGLIFAVLSERIRWSTAFKVIIFMPMAVSFLSAGVTWRLIYEEDPQLGLANAAARGVAGIVHPPGVIEGARPSDEDQLQPEDQATRRSSGWSRSHRTRSRRRPRRRRSRSRTPRRSRERCGWTSRRAAAARPV